MDWPAALAGATPGWGVIGQRPGLVQLRPHGAGIEIDQLVAFPHTLAFLEADGGHHAGDLGGDGNRVAGADGAHGLRPVDHGPDTDGGDGDADRATSAATARGRRRRRFQPDKGQGARQAVLLTIHVPSHAKPPDEGQNG